MLAIQIAKINNTCVCLDKKVYNPIRTINGVDFYELPINDSERKHISIIHYSQNNPNSIKSVFDNNQKLYNEIKSTDINLFYCKIDFWIKKIKQKAYLKLKVEQVIQKDFIGTNSYCQINIVQKNIEVYDTLQFFFPTKKIGFLVFFIEFISQLFVFVFCIINLIIWGYHCIQDWNTPHLYVGPYPFIFAVMPLTVFAFVLIILESHRVKKNTIGRTGTKNKGKGNTGDGSLC